MAINLKNMFEPEYRTGFRILKKEIGLWSTLKAAIPAAFGSLRIKHEIGENADEAERNKVKAKNHFRLLALMYRKLQKKYGTQKTSEIMRKVLMEGGHVFFRGFTPLSLGDDLTDFIRIYKDFESQNIVFDVIEESKRKFEIVIRRC
ncbi:unnamed protein product, partial [marine sediment metagenome]